ncbi:Adenylate kinase 9, partial [Nestor notabilis]
EITADHPEVQAMVEATRSASVSEVTVPPEIYTEVLERAIAELIKNNKDRFPGAPEKGGWVVDNYPLSVDHWSALSEKGLLPDTVVCLKDTKKNGVCIIRRTYSANRDEINPKILKRLTDEALEEKNIEEERREMQEKPVSEEEQSHGAALEKACQDTVRANCSQRNRELAAQCGNIAIRTGPSSQSQSHHPRQEQGRSDPGVGCQPVTFLEEHPLIPLRYFTRVSLLALITSGAAEIILPEFTEDDFLDMPEMETVRKKIDLFMNDWKTVESEIKQSSVVQVADLEIAEQTPESLLNQTVLVMEKPFKYHGWELSAEDLDEEAEDLAAESEDEEVEEEENENEEDEEQIKEKKRHMGDTKHFCPVSLKENFVLYPGLYDHAANYREKIYYFSSPEYRDKFLKNPEEYVAHNEPIQVR